MNIHGFQSSGSSPSPSQFFRVFVFAAALVLAGCLMARDTVRIGYFPNLTHAQALIGVEQGAFQKALGAKDLEFKIFNAGPAAIEALFAGELDIAYVGPNPALNGYLRSKGKALKVVASSASGGAALVVQKDLDFKGAESLRGKKLATPQLGGTQDVAARQWILKAGLKPESDIQLAPVANADALLLFQQKSVAAVWTVEPWVSRLEAEAGAKLAFEEKTLWKGKRYVTTCLIASQDFLSKHPEEAKALIAAHADLTEWILKHPAEAKKLANARLKIDTGKALPQALLDKAWSRLEFSVDIAPSLLIEAGESARALGFIKEPLPSIEQLFDLTALAAWKAGKSSVAKKN